MKLERYTNQKLIQICTDIFYDYMSSTHESFFYKSQWENTEDKTPVDMVHEKLNDLVIRDNERIQMFREMLTSYSCTRENKDSINNQIEFLRSEINYVQCSNMNEQKELYNSKHSIDYTRTAVRIPLDKRINSFYDDLVLEVLFYDDTCTLNGKYDDYKALETQESRRNFIKENTEITHLGLSYFKDNTHILTIGIKGALNFSDPRVKESRVMLLKPKFSDFERLTLADTMEISNNDIRQLLQSKIDLDKENFSKLAEKEVRGDVYGVYKSPCSEDLYIRYICPSTGRVYYNMLNLRNLSLSPYYEEGNAESYINSWWNINTIGGDVEGEPILRC